MATSAASDMSFLYDKIVPLKTYKIALVAARWNWEITGILLDGAKQFLDLCEIKDILIHYVPGSYELTYAAQKLAQQKDIDAVVCLGCVIKGETPHFDFICNAVAHGISNVSIKYDKPVSFGVLTTNTLEQAQERAGGKLGNKGSEAAATAISLLNEFAEFNKFTGILGF